MLKQTRPKTSNFNSMIVRLKVRLRTPKHPRRGGFQFYDSPIKSSAQSGCASSAITFQFYDSPIKRLRAEPDNSPSSNYFNSMIVRLKDFNSEYHKNGLNHFNSMIVRLKEILNLTPHTLVVFQFYDSPIKSSSYSVI